MTFYRYMMRNHRGTDTPEGDLANDMERDRERFPKNGKGKFDGWHRLIREHLVKSGACAECLSVFENCWEDYVRCEKNKLSKNSSPL